MRQTEEKDYRRFVWMVRYWSVNLRFPSFGLTMEYCGYASKNSVARLFKRLMKRGLIIRNGRNYIPAEKFYEIKLNI